MSSYEPFWSELRNAIKSVCAKTRLNNANQRTSRSQIMWLRTGNTIPGHGPSLQRERHRRRAGTWGAPRIHGELKMLGFDISKRTVQRWMRKAPRNLEPAKRWAAFLNNHRQAIAAMDFFTVPTLTFGVLH